MVTLIGLLTLLAVKYEGVRNVLVGIGRAFGAVTGITGAVNAFNGLLSNVGGLNISGITSELSVAPSSAAAAGGTASRLDARQQTNNVNLTQNIDARGTDPQEIVRVSKQAYDDQLRNATADFDDSEQ